MSEQQSPIVNAFTTIRELVGQFHNSEVAKNIKATNEHVSEYFKSEEGKKTLEDLKEMQKSIDTLKSNLLK